ncbi:hypothetical protein [Portibacter lacus]|uniref:Uncharacterized protein n=1 Tax=Portibacter lacus TaxID=1099794 RepID=A0AA37SLJ8_9BACT|nr:hypothetical protein [Portibacter lacus]GLR16456.1 hypothetical protein GCM10007940_10710 [Portibacter lacus]
MKNGILIVLAILSFAKIGSAQLFIDGKELRQETTQYIEIEFFSVVGSADVKMFIDYGQNVGFMDRKNRIVSDKKGKALIFNSPVHGLNWLYENGYEVLNVYNPKSGGTTVNTDLIYLIQKRKM